MRSMHSHAERRWKCITARAWSASGFASVHSSPQWAFVKAARAHDGGPKYGKLLEDCDVDRTVASISTIEARRELVIALVCVPDFLILDLLPPRPAQRTCIICAEPTLYARVVKAMSAGEHWKSDRKYVFETDAAGTGGGFIRPRPMVPRCRTPQQVWRLGTLYGHPRDGYGCGEHS